jgi:hypothetical protein
MSNGQMGLASTNLSDTMTPVTLFTPSQEGPTPFKTQYCRCHTWFGVDDCAD